MLALSARQPCSAPRPSAGGSTATASCPTHGDYPNAVRDLAHELDAPLIDLTVFTTWLYEDLGDAASRSLLSHFAPGETPGWPAGLVDDTHFRVEGARKIAAFVGRSLRAIERKDGDAPARGRSW